MEISEVIRAAIQELVRPELDELRAPVRELRTGLEVTNTRLGAFNNHLLDQSRRLDQTNQRIDLVRAEESAQMQQMNARLDAFFANLVPRPEFADVLHRLERLEDTVSHLVKRVA